MKTFPDREVNEISRKRLKSNAVVVYVLAMTVAAHCREVRSPSNPSIIWKLDLPETSLLGIPEVESRSVEFRHPPTTIH